MVGDAYTWVRLSSSPRLGMLWQGVNLSLIALLIGVMTFRIYAATSHYDVGIRTLPNSHWLPIQVRDELYQFVP